MKKRRKDTDNRSKAWDHFEKILEQGKLVKARCVYSYKTLNADTNKWYIIYKKSYDELHEKS